VTDNDNNIRTGIEAAARLRLLAEAEHDYCLIRLAELVEEAVKDAMPKERTRR